MPKTTLYSLNSNAGAFTSIPSTIPARRVEVREDESGTAQGLQYQKPDDNFTNTYNVGTPAGPDQPQIVLGNVVAHGHGRGQILGLPAQTTGGSTIPATTYLKVRSKGAGTTTVRVVEYE
jgi:hypothetical protein